MAGGVAPGAAQVVYFAPNTDQGFVDAVTTAVHASPTPMVISISWGQSEDAWTAQARTSLDQAMADAAALGITVSVAAGDNGSGDGRATPQPHRLPRLQPARAGLRRDQPARRRGTGMISSETVWNDGASAAQPAAG